jgi:hypothetical protein
MLARQTSPEGLVALATIRSLPMSAQEVGKPVIAHPAFNP